MDRVEELIVVFNNNVLTCILVQIKALCILVTMIKYTSFYDKGFPCLPKPLTHSFGAKLC